MLTLDAYFTSRLQVLYLWFYDWTGIYVASISATAVMVGSVCLGLGWIQCGALLVNLLILIPYYLDQDKQRYTLFNYRAILLRTSLFRVFISFVMLNTAVLEFIIYLFIRDQHNLGMSINFAMVWVYINMMTICIREREPKEWFKRPSLAMEHS